MNADTEKIKDILARTKTEVAKVIIGQEHVVDHCLIAIFTGSHVLVEGVPGVGKTLLVKTLAHVLGCEFKRIQFTPDLMPADITGTHVFNLKDNRFSLIRGPVFTSFLLADEINRAPAKTQSALLEAMQERSVTIDRTTHVLSPDFTVFATQNPIEFDGTYPLPEAQKDRFLLKITMDHPSRAEELRLAESMRGDDSPESILAAGKVNKVLGSETLAEFRSGLSGILIKDELIAYMVDIVRKTRVHPSVLTGAGPRASQALLLSSRAMAALSDRDFVSPDDIKSMAIPVLEHRLILRPEFEIEGLTIREVIRDILMDVAVPR
ncbi:MAG: MoxR family ATPase [Proteobacteria bacterium]|nr:MoxR family ATPase [Pseudomonadota bacterium]